jgi:hypothetical protein
VVGSTNSIPSFLMSSHFLSTGLTTSRKSSRGRFEEVGAAQQSDQMAPNFADTETWMNKQSHFEPKPTLRASSVFAARPHFTDAVTAVAVSASDSDTGQGQSHCSIASDNKCESPNGAKLQRAAELYLNRIIRPKRGRAAAEASPPTLPLTVAWMLLPNQGRDTLGRMLGEMRISTAKNRVLQSMAGAFPSNAVLHKWGIAPSAACSLCGHPAETQHVQCLCLALKEARIRAHHNLAQRLWKGIRDASKGWIITLEQTAARLQGPRTAAARSANR